MGRKRKHRKARRVEKTSSPASKIIDYGCGGDLPAPFYRLSPEQVFDWMEGARKKQVYHDDLITISIVEEGYEF